MPTKPTVKKDDVHVIINDWESKFVGEATCFNSSGIVIWRIPSVCKGVEGPRWHVRNGDTPPGLYRAGILVLTQDNEPLSIWNSYGKYCIDMLEEEGQEKQFGRAGICWHGGGSAAPDPLADYQQLLPTFGCVRSYNRDFQDKIVPLYNALQRISAKMWITVNQYA